MWLHELRHFCSPALMELGPTFYIKSFHTKQCGNKFKNQIQNIPLRFKFVLISKIYPGSDKQVISQLYVNLILNSNHHWGMFSEISTTRRRKINKLLAPKHFKSV